MKIDATSKFPVVRKGAGHSAGKADSVSDPKTGKTDVVDFSKGSIPTPDRTLTNLKSSLLQDVAANASPDRLASLSKIIKAGQYRVATDELVDAILGGDV